MNFARCSICTLPFCIEDIASLRCGHTFHEKCIDRWITSSKTCPNCRTTNFKKDITKLYFDDADKSMLDTSAQLTQTSNNALIAELQESKDARKALEVNLKEHQEKVSSLARQLKREQSKTSQLQTKDMHIRHLESQLSDQQVLKEQMAKYKRRVEASEFYTILTKNTGDDNAIDKYVNKNGNPDEAKFLKMMRAQRDEELKKNKKLGEELARERQDKRNKEKALDKMQKEFDQLATLFGEERCRKRKVDAQKEEAENRAPPATAAGDKGKGKGGRPSFGFSFTDPEDKGEIEWAARNFAFDDSSIEFLEQPTCSQNLLEQFDPIIASSKSQESQKVKAKNAKAAKVGTTKKPYLPDDLSPFFSSKLLAHANL